MARIPWKLPGPDDAGFLRRRRDLIMVLDAEPNAENNEQLIEALVPYVDLPDFEAREALLDCTQAEYGAAILKLLGYGFKANEKKGGKSGAL